MRGSGDLRARRACCGARRITGIGIVYGSGRSDVRLIGLQRLCVVFRCVEVLMCRMYNYQHHKGVEREWVPVKHRVLAVTDPESRR